MNSVKASFIYIIDNRSRLWKSFSIALMMEILELWNQFRKKQNHYFEKVVTTLTCFAVHLLPFITIKKNTIKRSDQPKQDDFGFEIIDYHHVAEH